jgi:hypothetical protein
MGVRQRRRRADYDRTLSRKLKLGDVLEIETPVGLLYAQAVNYHAAPPTYGPLFRVPLQLFTERPLEFDAVRSLAFFCPLHLAVDIDYPKVDFRRVGRFDVPAEWREFPTFKEEAVDPENGQDAWKLWDGKREWFVDDLSDEQLAAYPVLKYGTPYVLVDDALQAIGIEVDTPTFNDWFGIVEEARPEGVDYYLYFPNRRSARAAAVQLESQGTVELRETEGEWLVHVHTNPETDELEETRFEAVAKNFGGTYDGYDMSV